MQLVRFFQVTAALALTAGLSSFVTSHFWRAEDTANVNAMLESAVTIKTISHVKIDSFGDSVWSSSTGSGFLVSRDPCEVWTNQHVIGNAAVVQIYPRGWEKYEGIPATVINASARSEVAILHMDRCDGITVAKFGDSSRLRQGQLSYAVGNPLGRNPDSITKGIISHLQRYLDGPIPYLQTDAVIAKGNSGGPLFNHEGEVIGINTALATTQEGGATGLSYAIPINYAQKVATDLKQGGERWGDAGLNEYLVALSSDEAAIFGVPTGYSAVNLSKDPADGASEGRLFARDVIYKVNDTPVVSVNQVKRQLERLMPGDVANFHIVRNGALDNVEVTLAQGVEEDEHSSEPDTYDGLLGMQLSMWDEDSGEKSSFKQPVITRVHSMGPAHRARIISSQHSAAMLGFSRYSYLHDVKMITGIVTDGEYHPVKTVEDLDGHVTTAYEQSLPVLLEIEYWKRESPKKFSSTEFELMSKAFFKIDPTPAPPELLEAKAEDQTTDTAGQKLTQKSISSL